MDNGQLLQKVKTDLRIDFDDLDADISDNIAAAQQDLQTAGVKSAVEVTDELTLRAIKLYCRWQYNFDGRAEQYENAYNKLKITLALSGEHSER